MPSKNQKRRQSRRINKLRPVEKHYIFCEGKRTEPLYFTAFKNEIEKNPVYRNAVTIQIEGLGKDIPKILDVAKNYLERRNINTGTVWCVYDKDDLSDSQFDFLEKRAQELNQSKNNGLNYRVAWSNQCFEYWIMLHFSFYQSNTDRATYIRCLNSEFKKCGCLGYNKLAPNVFDILNQHGNPKEALRRAKQRVKDCGNVSPSKSSPATLVHILVEELAQYLPPETKKKFK